MFSKLPIIFTLSSRENKMLDRVITGYVTPRSLLRTVTYRGCYKQFTNGFACMVIKL